MTAREAAYQVLIRFDKSHERLDQLLENSHRQHRLKGNEAKFLHNLTSGVLRHSYLLDWIASQLYTGEYKKARINLKIIFRLAFYEIIFLDFIPPRATINEYVNLVKKKLHKSVAGKVNAILRAYFRQKPSMDAIKNFKFPTTQISVQYSFPEWIINRWIAQWGEEETKQLCAAFNRRPEFSVRINERRIQPEDFRNLLLKEKVNFTPSKHFANFIHITDLQKIQRLGFFQDGYCSIQDESAYLSVRLMEVDEHDTVLDVCTAPGGKLTAFGEQNTREQFIIGADSNYSRLRVVRENLQRLQFPDIKLINAEAQSLPFNIQFSKILVDAPCSGLGTIGKHPDIKWRRSLEEIFEFQKLQLDMLESVAKFLKPGGRLVYSTCTIDPAENDLVIQTFMKKNKAGFRYLSLPDDLHVFSTDGTTVKTFPHIHFMDGSFAVAIQKSEKSIK